MSAARNFYNKAVPTKNLITTITGIAVMVINLAVTVLLATGKITAEQSGPLTESLSGIVAIIGQLIGYVSAIILMFKAVDPVTPQ
jgi:hypothetical protein